MSGIAGAVLALLKLAGLLAAFAKDRQMLRAGQAEAIAEGAGDVIRSVGMADQGRAGMEHPLGADGGVWSDGVRDKYSRH